MSPKINLATSLQGLKVIHTSFALARIASSSMIALDDEN